MLPYDIICQVISQLHELHPLGVHSTIQVNRDWATASRPFVFCEASFVAYSAIDLRICEDRLSFLIETPHAIRHVKEIKVHTKQLPSPGLRNRDFIRYEESFDAFFSRLAEVLCGELVGNHLQHFKWTGGIGIPDAILRSLEAHHPLCQLNIADYDGYALPVLYNLSHLRATVLTLDRPLHRFGHIISCSPHLNSLDLTLHAQDSHVQRIPNPPPLLQDTTCTSAPSQTLSFLHLRGFYYAADCAPETVAFLSQWPNLRTLHLTLRLKDDSSYLLHALADSGPSLPPLRALAIHIEYIPDLQSAPPATLVALLRALPAALRRLQFTISDPYAPELLEAIGTYHGPSLEYLELFVRATLSTPLVDQAHLDALLAQCPHLTHLGLVSDNDLRYCTGVGQATGGLRSISSLHLRPGGWVPRFSGHFPGHSIFGSRKNAKGVGAIHLVSYLRRLDVEYAGLRGYVDTSHIVVGDELADDRHLSGARRILLERVFGRIQATVTGEWGMRKDVRSRALSSWDVDPDGDWKLITRWIERDP
ncbi:hypothetical protein PUNSTDRAFT_145794 [Punctularia strigosozonata HHB-11173 SS5]|uniref:uncharacterized protein n=1 Tax=Punctularia strigosozonata (strain HHB-11173) TaxID=741275 RepID=UPI0004417622|nr:uncharacterized protein PUNSTDRAFT_145794 [Punctularia strigosozonata HHB-11173 SS5]EIN05920.1 hypothetical protein PUNSTDRAFT_145794 [Punctularia strigosozonata HHB-11173 SS5]